ncbi:MAG: glucodextranase DOMON-like domain-containing protein, partial [Myxococcota bacterium]|nr:glucodextranase DOMON-like domain-containing protein [Myxococcota bacterium]
PAKTDLLTRKVNEFEGQHRFGGGTDYDCDPHVVDLLMAPGKGGDDEKEAQYKALGGYACGADPSNPADYKLAEVPMVYP